MNKKIDHVVYTWLLAVLLHPVVFEIYSQIEESYGFDLSTHLSLALVGLGFSLPALLFCLVAISIITKFKTSKAMLFLVWLISVVISIQVSLLIIACLFGSVSLYPFAFELAIPGSLSAILSILIRQKQFFQLVKQSNTLQEDNPQNVIEND